jgi:hypothetical protein
MGKFIVILHVFCPIEVHLEVLDLFETGRRRVRRLQMGNVLDFRHAIGPR